MIDTIITKQNDFAFFDCGDSEFHRILGVFINDQSKSEIEAIVIQKTMEISRPKRGMNISILFLPKEGIVEGADLCSESKISLENKNVYYSGSHSMREIVREFLEDRTQRDFSQGHQGLFNISNNIITPDDPKRIIDTLENSGLIGIKLSEEARSLINSDTLFKYYNPTERSDNEEKKR